MKLGIDLDDVIAVCAVPYLRKFAQEFGVELPDEREIGWHLLASLDERVSPADRDRFRIKLYDGTFFADLDIYPECPAVLERMVEAGHDLFFVTARAERRRMTTETWLREKGILRHAKAVHLKPMGDCNPDWTRRRPNGQPGTRKGRKQAEAVADELAKVRFDKVVSSDLSRTRDTADVIASRQAVPVEVVPDLCEIDVGERTGTAFDEARGLPNWRDGGFVAWPGGEALAHVV